MFEEEAVLLTPREKEPELDLNFHTDMAVGEILRRTRVHYGQSLYEIESVLRIRASQLEALEQGDLSSLPGRVYAIGFVRSYSEYLGLDGDKMVHLFKQQHGGKQKKPDLSFPVAASESKVPNLAVIGSSIFGVIVLVGFISFLMFPKEKQNDIPPVPDELTKSRLSEAPALVGEAGPSQAVTPGGAQAPSAAVPPPSAALAPAGTAQTGAVTDGSGQKIVPVNRIVMEISDATWVEIRNASGSAILRQVLKPGDIYLVPNEPGLIMATGNAGGIKLKVDGKELSPLGDTGQIRRKIALDPNLLSAGSIQ